MNFANSIIINMIEDIEKSLFIVTEKHLINYYNNTIKINYMDKMIISSYLASTSKLQVATCGCNWHERPACYGH